MMVKRRANGTRRVRRGTRVMRAIGGVRRRARRAGKTLAAGLSNGLSRIFANPLLLFGFITVILFACDALKNPYYCTVKKPDGSCQTWTTGPSLFYKSCHAIDTHAPYLHASKLCTFIQTHPNSTTAFLDGLFVTSFKLGSRLYPSYLALWILGTTLLPEGSYLMYLVVSLCMWLYFVQKKTTNRRIVLLGGVALLYAAYVSGL
uniref:Uncharacterized protein n=1 Tax=Scaphoideus titanus permutotetra-like virus 1 TaxID=2716555 RepID=A0A6G7NS49_9VIRU|nr:hypothetical protein [Scaphoideus titanus permutotetra-like virus 1]